MISVYLEYLEVACKGGYSFVSAVDDKRNMLGHTRGGHSNEWVESKRVVVQCLVSGITSRARNQISLTTTTTPPLSRRRWPTTGTGTRVKITGLIKAIGPQIIEVMFGVEKTTTMATANEENIIMGFVFCHSFCSFLLMLVTGIRWTVLRRGL